MKVVIIDDAPDVIEVVSLCFKLRWPGVDLLSSLAGEPGVELVGKENPDVVILDIGLPDIDGFEVLRQIRLFSDVPVVILTVRGEEIDKLKGFELGADDYVTKPFSHLELLARVRAVLRRRDALNQGMEMEPFISGTLHIDYNARQVFMGDKEVKLTPIEYGLLYHLSRNAGRVMTHGELLSNVQGPEYTEAAGNLKVYIQRLRSKIEETPPTPSSSSPSGVWATASSSLAEIFPPLLLGDRYRIVIL